MISSREMFSSDVQELLSFSDHSPIYEGIVTKIRPCLIASFAIPPPVRVGCGNRSAGTPYTVEIGD